MTVHGNGPLRMRVKLCPVGLRPGRGRGLVRRPGQQDHVRGLRLVVGDDLPGVLARLRLHDQLLHRVTPPQYRSEDDVDDADFVEGCGDCGAIGDYDECTCDTDPWACPECGAGGRDNPYAEYSCEDYPQPAERATTSGWAAGPPTWWAWTWTATRASRTGWPRSPRRWPSTGPAGRTPPTVRTPSDGLHL